MQTDFSSHLLRRVVMDASPSASKSLTQSPSPTHSSAATPSSTQSQTQTASLIGSSIPPLSKSQTASVYLTPSSTATPSSSLMPFSLLFSLQVENVSTTLSSAVLSDGLPWSVFRLWLSHCPSSSDTAALAAAILSCVVVNSGNAVRSDVFVAVGSPTLSTMTLTSVVAPVSTIAQVERPCIESDMGGSEPALLTAAVFVGAFFGAPPMSAGLTCSIQTAAAVSLAQASLQLTLLPTRWPLWDDAILVSSSGIMRSARLGVTVNATSALFAAAEAVDQSATILTTLATALASPTVVIASARAVWSGGPGTLNYSVSLAKSISDTERAAFSLTLSGASRIVLFGGVVAQRLHLAPGSLFNATLGGLACNVAAVSDDGVWAVLDTPTAVALCGSESGDCGYAPLTLTSESAGNALGSSLVCPPFCPGEVGGGAVPIAISSDIFALGTDPPTPVGSLPSLLPAFDSVASSAGIYYAAACVQTGLWTDPATGACSNESDPAASNCAFGSGASCSACPDGALCPGGSRLWPRVGYWAPCERASSVLPCGPPDPDTKCGGWKVSRGTVQCGTGYRDGSPLCGACSPGYYLPGDGSCTACPAIKGLWDRFRVVILLLCGVILSALVVGLLLIALVKFYGGTLVGSAHRLLDLTLWSVAALQTVSQAAPASAASLPSFLALCFRGVSVLQLDGVLLPPACTGAYAFESQVRKELSRSPASFPRSLTSSFDCRLESWLLLYL